MKNNKIILPRKNKEGKYRVSYSQINSWNEKKAFNTLNGKAITGKEGYILDYFLNHEFPPSMMDVYAPWGSKVEDAICMGIYDGFDKQEIEILKSIETLGVFQSEVSIDFGDFCLEGFIDDTNEDRSIIRDYKTASESSAKKYSTLEYRQLEVYALDYYKKTGLIPHTEVCLILREGSHIKPPMKVAGTRIIPRSIAESTLNEVEQWVINTVSEISTCYKVWLKINGVN